MTEENTRTTTMRRQLKMMMVSSGRIFRDIYLAAESTQTPPTISVSTSIRIGFTFEFLFYAMTSRSEEEGEEHGMRMNWT